MVPSFRMYNEHPQKIFFKKIHRVFSNQLTYKTFIRFTVIQKSKNHILLEVVLLLQLSHYFTVFTMFDTLSSMRYRWHCWQLSRFFSLRTSLAGTNTDFQQQWMIFCNKFSFKSNNFYKIYQLSLRLSDADGSGRPCGARTLQIIIKIFNL